MPRSEIARAHLPSVGSRQPLSTYRLQLQKDFTFADAAAALPYLEALGVTDLYLSPILQAAPGSTHGYDVVDHSRISRELGGRAGFETLAWAAHSRGMGVVVDVVPNHMAIPTPLYENRVLWSLLRDGPASPYVDWFDGVFGRDGILMPVLGTRVGTALANNEFTLDRLIVPGFADEGEATVLRWFDHVFPVRPGTESLAMSRLLQSQHYRLAYWKVADEELNYRRFFDVDTLAALRVEDPAVFAATHALLLELHRAGHIDGFRIDHPDGLADPRGYLRALAEATGGAWIVAEKILEPHEELPDDWPIAGTTGYDASWRTNSLQVDPGGALELATVSQELAGELGRSLEQVKSDAKRMVATTSLHAEVHRLAMLAAEVCHDDIRLRDHTLRALTACIVELVVAVDRYRAYVVPGESAPAEAEAVIREAAARAAANLEPDQVDTLDVVVDLVLGREVGSAGRVHEERRAELIVRFQQVCGAVTAKGVEDTAFYRWTMLTSLCEVGGAPQHFGITPDEFHEWCGAMALDWPVTMTLGSTHDSKRSEDVRCRIGAISQFGAEWHELVAALAGKLDGVEGHTRNLVLQTLAGTWTEDGPISAERLHRYLLKACREQKLWTSWTSPAAAQEEALLQRATAMLTDPEVVAAFEGWVALTRDSVRTAILSSKAIQLTCLGVADNYQGCETTQTYLVDPDNRAAVDVAALSHALERLGRHAPRNLAEEKLALTAAILQLRRRRREAFVGEDAGYRPLATSTGHVIAFQRGADVVTVATRLARTAPAGADHTVVLPDARWRDVVSGHEFPGGAVKLRDLLGHWPVVVLERIA